VKHKHLFLSIFIFLSIFSFSQTLSVTSQSISCATLGSATVNVSGGLGPFSFTWMPSGQTASVATGIAPGIYTISAFDAGSSVSFSTIVSFTSPTPFTGSLTNTSALFCNGATDGSAAFTNFSGGSGSQSYFWTNASNTFSVAAPNTLSAGNWTITVTDALTACAISNTFSISQPPALSITAVAATPSACVGSSVILTANASGGLPVIRYRWLNGPNTPTYVVTQTVSGTFFYTVEIKDGNDCAKTQTVSLLFSALPSITVSTTNTNVCSGANIALNANVGASPSVALYQWSGPSGFNSIAQNTVINNVSLNNNGEYSLSVTAINGCTTSAVLNVSVFPLPALIANASPACESQTISLGAFSPTGVLYVWSGPAGYTSNTQNPLISPASLANAGTYTVVVFSSINNCSTSATASQVVLPKPLIAALGSTVCVNETMTLSASSGIGTFFSWTGPSGFSSPNPTVIIGPTSLSQSGTYSILATGNNGCPNTTTVSALVKAVPGLTLSSNSPVCSGKPLLLTSSTATLFQWTGPNGFSAAVQNPSIAVAGISNTGVYDASITAANGCSATTNISVSIIPSPTISVSNVTVCETKTFSINALSSAAVSFSWSGPQNFTSILANNAFTSANSSQTGGYSVVVSDAAGCTNSVIANVLVNLNPNVLIASNNPVCAGKSLIMTATPAGTFNWAGPAGFVSTAQTASINATSAANSGVYTVTVTGLNTCSSSANLSVSINPLPQVTVNNRTVCENGTLNFSVNAAQAVGFSWTGPGNFISNQQNIQINAITLNQSGTYSLLVTGANSCTNLATALASVVPLPVVTVSLTKPLICAGETNTITASGANTYTWSTGAVNFVTIVNPSITSTYSVYATGVFGCSVTAITTATVEACTGLFEEIKGFGFLVYPNPTQNEIHIQYEGSSNEQVCITDVFGRPVLTATLNVDENNTLNLSQLKNGLYFISMQLNGHSYTKRLVVAR